MMVLRDILVPVDFEPTSYRALAFGRSLAQAFGAILHVLHVRGKHVRAVGGNGGIGLRLSARRTPRSTTMNRVGWRDSDG